MTDSDSKILLTTDHLRRMDDEVARLDSEISEMESLLVSKKAEREALLSRRRMVNELLVALGISVPDELQDPSFVVTVVSEEQPQSRVPRSRVDSGGATWMSEISRLLADEPDGMTYEDLRAGIDLGTLAERLRQSDKGLYGGVAKLEARGELVKHNGRLFSPRHHKTFMARVEQGLVEDIPAPSQIARPAPLADTILALIQSKPEGIEGREIVNDLMIDSRFSEVVTKNNSSVYNVLKRLLDRFQIRKVGRTYFPMDVNSAPESNSGAVITRS